MAQRTHGQAQLVASPYDCPSLYCPSPIPIPRERRKRAKLHEESCVITDLKIVRAHLYHNRIQFRACLGSDCLDRTEIRLAGASQTRASAQGQDEHAS